MSFIKKLTIILVRNLTILIFLRIKRWFVGLVIDQNIDNIKLSENQAKN